MQLTSWLFTFSTDRHFPLQYNPNVPAVIFTSYSTGESVSHWGGKENTPNSLVKVREEVDKHRLSSKFND